MGEGWRAGGRGERELLKRNVACLTRLDSSDGEKSSNDPVLPMELTMELDHYADSM
jgi:hypothetical protein